MKISKKNTEMTEELKQTKFQNEAMRKDINVMTIANEKVSNDKTNLERILEENKSYIRKLESRLLQGSKNQHLIEINNKLRKEIEDLKVKFI